MKNLKKILILVLVAAALVFGAAFGAFAEDEYTGTVDELSAKVQAAVNATEPGSRYNALLAVNEYLPTVDPASEGYSELAETIDAQALISYKELAAYADTTVKSSLSKAQIALTQAKEIQSLFGVEDSATDSAINTTALDIANRYLAEIDDTEVASTARNQSDINRLNAFLKLELCDTASDGYKALVADFEARKALQTAARDAARQAMYDVGKLTDHSLETLINTDFASGFSWSTSNQMRGNVFVAKNGYLSVDMLQSNGGYVQHSFNEKGRDGLVIDFDYTNFGQPAALHLEGGGHIGFFEEGVDTSKYPFSEGDYTYGDDGKTPKAYASYMKISAEGHLLSGNTDGSKVILENAVVNGEWTHITVIFEPETFTFNIYCEYEFIASYDARCNRGGFLLTYNPSAVRVAPTSVGNLAIDNLQVYQGTALRELGVLEKLTTHERFVYYANYYLNENTADVAGRYLSLTEVEKKWDNYVDAEGNFIEVVDDGMDPDDLAALNASLEAAINAVKDYDKDAFIVKVGKANTAALAELATSIKNVQRSCTETSINARGVIVEKIETLIAGASNIFELGETYTEAYDTYVTCRNQYVMDKNIISFNDKMYRYSMVETANSLEKYHTLAKEIFENADMPIDPELAKLEGFEEFAKYYDLYVNATKRIDDVKKENNAKTIIGCYRLISGFSEDEWEANYDYINPYVVMIRGIVNEKFYNFDYVGVAEVVEEFAYMDAFFYGLLQEVHIAELSSRLDFVFENDAYVEKMGTLSYIERYLASNDIDRTNPEIARLIVNFETAKDELEFREQDYNTVLKQNASYFVSLVEKMRISDDFNEKKALYDQAIGFYFALDASGDDVKDAILIFDEHTIWFERGEAASVDFIEMVGVLEAATTEDEKYAALVQCYMYSLDAVPSYDGVSAAMQIYTAAYNEYNGYVTAANEVIDSTGNTVAAVRANCGVKPIIAVIIKKLFD